MGHCDAGRRWRQTFCRARQQSVRRDRQEGLGHHLGTGSESTHAMKSHVFPRREFLQASAASALLLSSSIVRANPVSSTDAWARAADISRNVRPPTFPDRLFDITKFGATPDGATLATQAIANAIEAC